MSYDFDGELTGISSSGGSVGYTYDALGRRFSRTAGGVTTRYVYDAAGQVLLEEVGNSISSVYTWGVDGLVRKDGEYPLVDGLGSERVVTNGSQGVTASMTYDAFGNVVARSGSSSDPYQFAGSSGYRNDGDRGLTYVGARYYDAQVGRFITRDTYLDQKPYLYCEHDPVNCLDPDGHKPRKHRPPHKHGSPPVVKAHIHVELEIHAGDKYIDDPGHHRRIAQKGFTIKAKLDIDVGVNPQSIGNAVGGAVTKAVGGIIDKLRGH